MSRIRQRVLPLPLLALVCAWPLDSLAQQCNPLQSFASVGNGGQGQIQLEIDASQTADDGNEIGRFWSAGNSLAANSFDAGGNCPSGAEDGWWTSRSSGNHGIKGILGHADCLVSLCPVVGSDELIFVVEDTAALGSTAHFIALRVNGFFGGIRTWNLARVAPSNTVLPMLEFPEPSVVFSTFAAPGEIEVTMDFPDVAANVHGVTAGDVPLPASAVIASYDLYRFVGPPGSPHPGRSADQWTLAGQTAYADAAATAETLLPCPAAGATVLLALGLSFHGGAGPDVRSALVGPAIEIECGLSPPTTPAGAVPDGDGVAGEPLRMAKVPGESTLTLTWDYSCQAADFNYAIYEGLLGDFTSHERVTCNTSGDVTYQVQPSLDSSYYLVVPMSPPQDGGIFPAEGSYGLTSEGDERPQNFLSACLPQSIGSCF